MKTLNFLVILITICALLFIYVAIKDYHLPNIRFSSSHRPLAIIGQENVINSLNRSIGKVEMDLRAFVENSREEREPSTKCVRHFHPKCEMYWYVRFWKRVLNAKDCFRSPLATKWPSKYVVFRPDGGGWNNIRMAAETVVVFALISGRTLVLPPEMVFYLLNKNNNGEDNLSLFSTFFDFSKLKGLLHIMSMKEFLTLVSHSPPLQFPSPPKSPQYYLKNQDELWKYLEASSYVRSWEPGKYFIGFNFTSSGELLPLAKVQSDIRMKKFASHLREVIPYDAFFANQSVVYFPGDYRHSHRILTHFYSYLFLADPSLERIYKRMVRDRLHYSEEIFCLAGKIIKWIHEEAANLMQQPLPKQYHRVTGGGNIHDGATYFAFHIRRGDFQFEETRLSSPLLWNNTYHLLNTSISRLLYIASDDLNRKSFQAFHNHFEVRYIEDYLERLKSSLKHEKHGNELKFNKNYIGMIEQIICANAHTFIGTPLSTFTGYITRMRGYYRDGRYAHTYYSMKKEMYQLQRQRELKGPFWAREFAVAHANIDDDFVSSAE